MSVMPARIHATTGAVAEFDSYAHGYAAGMDNSTKRLLGDSADDFIAVKLRWLLRAFPALRSADSSFRVLDYGCGTGTLLRVMRQAGLHATLAGCDVSHEMLDEAVRSWPSDLPAPVFRVQAGAEAAFPDGTFDLVIISAVLHHVPPEDRSGVYAALRRSLRPQGSVVVFEHNPLNPVTRYVVAHTPIDQKAILLHAGEARNGLDAAGFSDVRTRYLMFFPPRFASLVACEPALGWLPMGAQYAVTASRR
jgi:2-polyprenyl-3-methyl-5-hydroxy-6-metoxy-1,4-benzoquinol methylase